MVSPQDTAHFLPHGFCYLWQPGLVWLHVVSDTLIGVAYFTIPITLLYFIRQRRDVPFSWMFICFGTFILACGATHLMNVYNVWVPSWWLSGGVKAVTAAASVPTAILLGYLVPRAVALPSPSALRAANAALAEQIAERERAEAALLAANAELQRMHRELEQRVEARTRALKDTEQQLLQAQKMEAVGRLAGGVAHDFNNLLTVINGVSAMALDDLPANAPLRAEFEEILDAGGRAATLTGQLLTFSRRNITQPQVLDLNAVVASVQGMLRRLIGEEFEIRLALSPELGATWADRSQLEQIVMNLAVNARDAMPDGGVITIETADVRIDESFASERLELGPGEYVMLAVSDTGAGMDPVTQAHIFEPFFTTKAQDKGTGLGLSMVYGIVKESGGGIYVYSEPDHGSSFKIYLPLIEAAVGTSRAVWSDEPVGGNETVLVAEDDPAVRRLTAAVLRSHGYRVLDVASGAAALEAGERHSVNLLLTDMVMPGMNGPALARQFTTRWPTTRVLYMSGYTDAAMQNRVLSTDVAFIQKPFTPRGLSRKVREVLDLKQQKNTDLSVG